MIIFNEEKTFPYKAYSKISKNYANEIIDSYFICPQCRREHNKILHNGEYFKCRCGLLMTRSISKISDCYCGSCGKKISLPDYVNDSFSVRCKCGCYMSLDDIIALAYSDNLIIKPDLSTHSFPVKFPELQRDLTIMISGFVSFVAVAGVLIGHFLWP